MELEEIIEVLEAKRKVKGFLNDKQMSYVLNLRRTENDIVKILTKLKESGLFSDFELGYLVAMLFTEFSVVGSLRKVLWEIEREIEKSMEFEKMRKAKLGIV
ncbi:MAG: hypothetical protein ACTSV7_15045 [Candidatus Baldrarchaeia archaeon]